MGKEDDDKDFTRLKFEHDLINRRLTWLLSTQSILFAAYGLAIKENMCAKVFLAVTSTAGVAVASMIFIGILSGVFAKWNTWQDSAQKEFGVRTWITILALLPDLMLPVVFACAWLWIREGAPKPLFWCVLSGGATVVVITLLILFYVGRNRKRKNTFATYRRTD